MTKRHWIDAIVARASMLQTQLTLGRSTPKDLQFTDFLTWPVPDRAREPEPEPDDDEARRRRIRQIQMMGSAWAAANNGARA